ncbi:hypothetical protein, partial [Escherichia coli]|uniref:hypothetical protein n=1 Tax=Escherichia coli TaxID=562 RepID=UPI002B2498A0
CSGDTGFYTGGMVGSVEVDKGKGKYNYVIYWQIELTGGRTLRVRKVSNNNPLHQQTSNRVPRYAGNTRRLNWRMV